MTRFAAALLGLFGLLGLSEAAWAQDDPFAKKIADAKAAVSLQHLLYVKALGEWLDKREDAARQDGSKKLVDQIKAERLALRERFEVPRSAPTLMRQKLTAAQKTLEAEYVAAVKGYTRLKQDDRAGEIDKELELFKKTGGLPAPANGDPVPDPLPKTPPDSEAKAATGWGTRIDPDKDCKFEEKDGALRITVPGTLHELSPQHRSFNAPRALRVVEGDFVAEVKVTHELMPSKKATSPTGISYVAGGLLIWGDEKNYARLERNAYSARGGPFWCAGPQLVVWKAGESMNTMPNDVPATWFKGGSTWFRLTRKGDKVSASYSHDGKEWADAYVPLAVALPKKVRVGVVALNTADKPLTVQFDAFSVKPLK